MAKRNSRKSKVSKRELEMARRQERANQFKKVLIPAILIVIVAFAIMLAMNGQDGEPQPTDSVYVNEAKQVEIDSSEITSSARYYSYDASGTEIRFFALRASDGQVRVALDACDVCYNAKKGYVQEGDDMKCNNCGNKYASDGIGTKNVNGGGCWPGYIPITEDGGKVLIKTSDLRAKNYMF